MALQWEIVAAANCIEVAWSDVFDADEYIAFYNSLSEAPEFQPHMTRLYDLRNTKVKMGLNDFRLLATNIQQTEHLHGKRRVIILVNSELNFGLMRQFITTAAPLAAEYHITRDVAEAKSLAGVDTEHILIADR